MKLMAFVRRFWKSPAQKQAERFEAGVTHALKVAEVGDAAVAQLEDQIDGDYLFGSVNMFTQGAKAGLAMGSSSTPSGPRAIMAVAALNPLVALNISTGAPLDGPWSGALLTDYRLYASDFDGRHCIIQIGHMTVSSPLTPDVYVFKRKFIVRFPLGDDADYDDPVVQAEVKQTADAFLAMLNLNRVLLKPYTYRTDDEPDVKITVHASNAMDARMMAHGEFLKRFKRRAEPLTLDRLVHVNIEETT